MQSDTLISLLSRDVIAAICDRPGEDAATRRARETAALKSIQDFDPKDGVEIMLAGLIVMFQSLIASAAQDARHADNPDRAQRQVAQLSRAHMGYLRELRLHRKQHQPAPKPVPKPAPAKPEAKAAKPRPTTPPLGRSPLLATAATSALLAPAQTLAALLQPAAPPPPIPIAA